MKVYDCFTFFNEFKQLEIRLNELDGIVDYFVLVEATKTFSGQKKPLYFFENCENVAPFLKKIIHVVVDDMPDPVNGNRWPLEEYQRNCIQKGLSNCSPNDIIIISDVDEIPNYNTLKIIVDRIKNTSFINKFKNYLSHILPQFGQAQGLLFRLFLKIKIKLGNPESIFRFHHKHFEYYLNGYVMDELPGSVVMQNKVLEHWYKNNCHRARFLKKEAPYTIIKGGWHFSYLGASQDIINKIKSFAHSEFDNEKFTNPEHIEKCIADGENLFGKTGERHKIKYLALDGTWPKYVLDNVNLMSALIKK
jgi:beta-1,4-mannosyl-glycoprotein beta-1,4-N-acetylglucosaminyltransferase